MLTTLNSIFGERLKLDERLLKYTAARIGGPADYLVVAKTEAELKAAVSAAWDNEIPVRILGGGANVLASDAGFRGLVVVNHVSEIDFDGQHVHASSGTSLTVLARKCESLGVTGCEWAVSVPGTVGGAVVNNAGAHGGDMAAVVRSIEMFDPARGEYSMSAQELAYDYRTSSLKQRADRRFLVLNVTLDLKPDDPANIAERMQKNIAYRKQTQPPGASLGSIFKNPVGDFAGRLIESAGLKGYTIGGAQVSP
ncbi:MAG: UDP-N-acetylmuramate dehydrogenase, partial [Burkholderiales bacterium]|nr:UDP-N-acetylmuramate dehydrogenase [Anaerolineae bacterium]